MRALLKFIDTTTYTKDDRLAQVEKAANAGLAVKLEYMTLLGYDPIEAIASDWIETKLGLSVTKFINPLVSSHTQTSGSSNEGGAPEKDDGALTDEGSETKDKEKNQ